MLYYCILLPSTVILSASNILSCYCIELYCYDSVILFLFCYYDIIIIFLYYYFILWSLSCWQILHLLSTNLLVSFILNSSIKLGTLYLLSYSCFQFACFDKFFWENSKRETLNLIPWKRIWNKHFFLFDFVFNLYDLSDLK